MQAVKQYKTEHTAKALRDQLEVVTNVQDTQKVLGLF